MSDINSICVFCGSSIGQHAAFGEAAHQLGKELAHQHITLVYGGSSAGLMGLIADSALRHGGQVVGIIPEGIKNREVEHLGLTELIVVDSMHTRKSIMATRADAFIAMPGGFGTYEELFEVITWALLGIHRKPIALLNIGGYYDPLLHMIQHSVEQGFIRPEDQRLLRVSDRVDQVIPLLQQPYDENFRPKWLSLDQS